MKLPRAPITILLLQVCIAYCWAEEARRALDQLPEQRSVSPDGRYAVAFAHTGKEFLYVLTRTNDSGHAVSLTSSYHPDDDPIGQGNALRDAQGATVCWSDDSRFVAIEETNDRYKGTVLAAYIDEAGQPYPAIVPRKELLRRTGVRWDRCRLELDSPAWSAGGRLHLIISGKVLGEQIGPKQYSIKAGSTACAAVIRIGKNSSIEQVGPCHE